MVLTFLALLVVAGLVFLFAYPVVSVLDQTIDMVRLSDTVQGRIIHLDVVYGRTRRGGTSRPVVRVEYVVADQLHVTERLMPGRLGREVKWTGGGNYIRTVNVGQRVDVHFDPSSPADGVIEFGWFKFPVGMGCIIFGFVASQSLRRTLLIPSAGYAAMVYGFALIFLGPLAVRPAELHLYVLAWCGCWIVSMICQAIEMKAAKPHRS